MKGPSGHSSVRRSLIQLLALPLLSLSAPAAHAGVGFTTPFDPQTWLVVNTGGGVADQTLNYSGTGQEFGCNNDLDFGVPPPPNPGPNAVACVATYTAEGNNNDVQLVSSYFDATGGGLEGYARTTSLVFTNTFWRPYLISFNWSFTSASDPSSSSVIGQNVSFLVNPGFISPNGGSGNTYSYTSVPDTAYQDSQGWVAYVPPGATLSFSINTDNGSDIGVLTIKGFTTEEVPAPLPITGSSAVLLYSRRLRHRTRRAASQLPAIDPSTGKVLTLAEQRASHRRQLALKHYGTILAKPVQSLRPTSQAGTKS